MYSFPKKVYGFQQIYPKSLDFKSIKNYCSATRRHGGEKYKGRGSRKEIIDIQVGSDKRSENREQGLGRGRVRKMLTSALPGPAHCHHWEAAPSAPVSKSRLTGQNGGQASCSTRQAAPHPQPRLTRHCQPYLHLLVLPSACQLNYPWSRQSQGLWVFQGQGPLTPWAELFQVQNSKSKGR